jgi:hypothetical protein
MRDNLANIVNFDQAGAYGNPEGQDATCRGSVRALCQSGTSLRLA